MVTVGRIERLQPPRTSTVRLARFGREPQGRRGSEIFSSTRISLGSHPGDDEPDHNRRDGHEAHHGCDEGGQERGPVDALDTYSHKDYQGIGKREGAKDGYPCDYQDGGSVGRHAVDLPEAGDLPDEGPYGKKVDSSYHAGPDRREQCEENGVSRRRPQVTGVEVAEEKVCGEGDRGAKDATDRADEQHEGRRFLYGSLDLEVQVENSRREEDTLYHCDRAREGALQVELGGRIFLHRRDYTDRWDRACQIALRNLDLGPSKMVAERYRRRCSGST